MIESWVERLAGMTGLKAWMLEAFAVLLIALIVEWVARIILARLERLAGKTVNPWDDAVVSAIRPPLSLLIWWLGVSTAARLVVPTSGENLFFEDGFLGAFQQLGFVVALAWYALRLTIGVEVRLVARAKVEHERLDATTIHALSRITRIAILMTASLVFLDTLGVSIKGLLAAGGVGGLAIGLAAKDLFANFFGGLTIFMDRPFAVGDWILSPDKDIEGTVEKIGWRQTTIRRFNKRPLYVPNSVFSTIAVENPSRMTHRRIYELIGVRYDDIQQMRAITSAIDQMLRQHAEIAHDQIIMARFDEFATSSLNFFIYCMTRTKDWAKFHEVKEDVLLQVADIIFEHGADVAYPTSRMLIEPKDPELQELLRNEERTDT